MIEGLLDRFMFELPVEGDGHDDHYEGHEPADQVNQVPDDIHNQRRDVQDLTAVL